MKENLDLKLSSCLNLEGAELKCVKGKDQQILGDPKQVKEKNTNKHESKRGNLVTLRNMILSFFKKLSMQSFQGRKENVPHPKDTAIQASENRI